MTGFSIDCKECGKDLNLDPEPVEHGVDFLKTICSSCGEINKFSLVQEVAKHD